MDALRRHSLVALRAVEAVGRLGTLGKAAAELGVTVGAVSQHVRQVEAQLGKALFLRHRTGLAPTEMGHRLLPGLGEGFRLIDSVLGGLGQRAERVFVVTVPPVFAAKWLVWRLPRFQALRPDLRVRVDASQALVDLETSEADMAVRVGIGPWPRHRAEKLVERIIFPVCTPELAARLKTIDDLATVPAIRDHGSKGLWAIWLAAQGRDDLVLGPGPVFSDSSLCLDAALSCQGVMMGWPALAHHALRTGLLVAPFPKPVPMHESYWLVTAARKRPSADVKAFATWIRAELLADQSVV